MFLCSADLSFISITSLGMIYFIEFMQVISGHLGWVRSIAFDPSNTWFCTGSADRTIKVHLAWYRAILMLQILFFFLWLWFLFCVRMYCHHIMVIFQWVGRSLTLGIFWMHNEFVLHFYTWDLSFQIISPLLFFPWLKVDNAYIDWFTGDICKDIPADCV